MLRHVRQMPNYADDRDKTGRYREMETNRFMGDAEGADEVRKRYLRNVGWGLRMWRGDEVKVEVGGASWSLGRADESDVGALIGKMTTIESGIARKTYSTSLPALNSSTF